VSIAAEDVQSFQLAVASGSNRRSKAKPPQPESDSDEMREDGSAEEAPTKRKVCLSWN
jgi:hypothetical protein